MNSYDLGRDFEIVTQDFFIWLFNEAEIQVNNFWIQKAGYQFGFDVGFEIAVLNNDFFKRGIYIECKNYEKTILEKPLLYEKLIQFEMSPYESKNSIFIFLSPKVDFKNCTQDSNPVLLENYFNSKYDLKTIILTPNNKINKIFSLNNEIYYRVYGEELPVLPSFKEKNIIVNFFKKLLCSKGEIPNLDLLKERSEYLKEASIDDITNLYVERKLKTNKFSFLQEDKSLLEHLKDNDYILLLGEPGSGKTTELKNVAKYFQENIKDLGITPIFINLSNITEFKNITEVFPKNWETNSHILFLFDSFDEFEFKDKLSDQIESILKLKEISIKIIISCRTYAYNEELKSINPTKFYLDGFNYFQIIEVLSKQFNLSMEQYDEINKDKFKDILQDPFMLNRFGLFYQNNRRIPSNIFEIYNDVKSELTDDNIELYKIFALILEMTKNTSIEKNQLRSLFGLKYKKLVESKLIQKSFDKQSFKFIHKNYQEYFAALSLSDLNIKQILNSILIKGTKKTHPTFFNTITFLLNILDDDKYDRIVKWFIENEPELLFKADKNRIQNSRIKVFQEYFNRECIEKTLWISNNKTFSVKEIAEFADCDENIDYLILIISNTENHFRVLSSAINLLCYFNLTEIRKGQLKKMVLALLNDSQISLFIKSELVEFANAQQFIKGDSSYLNKIFKIFESETNKELNRALLSLLESHEDLDSFFWYINDEFLREVGIKERVEKDEVIRGNSWVLEELMLRLCIVENFIEIVKYYFDESKDYSNDNALIKRIVDRCVFFEGNDDDFIIKLLSSIEEKKKYYFRESLLKSLILSINQKSQIKAFDYLINNFKFENIGYFLASIINDETIKTIVKGFEIGIIDCKELEYFRNIIANHGNRELAGKFNELMIQKGFRFREPFLTETEFQELKAKFDARPQKNFDLLFEKNKLILLTEKIFKEHGKKISTEKMMSIDKDWYAKNGHSSRLDIEYHLLRKFVYSKRTEISFEDIKLFLEEDDNVIEEIISQIKGKEFNIKISAKQIDYLYKWCIKTSEQIDFNLIIRYQDINRFGLGFYYEKLRMVLYLILKFKFDLPKSFLLDCIEYFDVDSSNLDDTTLESLRAKINNDELFNNRIVYNLLNKKLCYFSLDKHVRFALKNKLAQTYPIIREYLLNTNYNASIYNELKDYIDITEDFNLLTELCQDIQSHICWSSIDFLMNLKGYNDFCIGVAIEYLNLDINDDKNYYYTKALSILFELNRPEALEYFLKYIRKDIIPSMNSNSYSNYNFIDDYNILQDLFEITYLNNRDRIGYHSIGSFMNVYVSNLSKNKKSFKKAILKLKEIEMRLRSEKNDNGIYYINNLIDLSENSYINSQSKALTFKEALTKIEEIIS